MSLARKDLNFINLQPSRLQEGIDPTQKTNSSSPLKMDGCKVNFPFGSRPVFRGELLVSRSVSSILHESSLPIC